MYINRIILIGNGFDLAHDKKTSYKNFIESYWFNRIQNIYNYQRKSNDIFCKITTWKDKPFQALVYDSCIPNPTIQTDILKYLENCINSKYITLNYNSCFFENINKFIEERGWVDIEYQYYQCLINPTYSPKSLNSELKELTNKLVEYLNSINIEITQKPV